jgi:hypothetical protein
MENMGVRRVPGLEGRGERLLPCVERDTVWERRQVGCWESIRETTNAGACWFSWRWWLRVMEIRDMERKCKAQSGLVCLAGLEVLDQ